MPLEKKPAVLAPWPPLPSNDPQGRYPEPFAVTDDPLESFWTVADKTLVQSSGMARNEAVKDLVFYNFLTNKPEEINYYLRTYVGCKLTDGDGKNYRFKGATNSPDQFKGLIFIPRKNDVSFSDMPVIVPKKKTGEARLIQFTYKAPDPTDPPYMVPGVDRTSDAVSSNLPGNSGNAERSAQGMAALAQFVSTVGSSKLADLATKMRLDSWLNSEGKDIYRNIQPEGKNEAAVVMVRRTRSTDPGLGSPDVFDGVFFIGYTNIKDADRTVREYWERSQSLNPRTPENKSLTWIYEYYVVTRMGPSE